MQISQTSEDRSGASALRSRLVEAARAIAGRDGVDGVTLSKAAAEAGLGRAQAYGLFARREDLLMSVVSEDLAALAHQMRGIDWQSARETDRSENAVVVSLPLGRPDDAAMVDAEEPALAAPVRQRLARRGELAQLLDARTDEADAKDIPRAPDAWLERRLRVFERGMGAIEARQEQVEKNARAAAAAAEDAVKSMQATVAALQARADAAEAKAKATANELRAALNEAALRIQTVESVAHAALAENHVPEIAGPDDPTAADPMIERADMMAPQPAETPEAPMTEAPRSYLSEVRKSVAAANAAAEAVADAKPTATRASTTRYLLGAIVVIAIFAAAAGMAFSQGVSDGRREALSHIVRVPRRDAVTADLAHTPLDRLTVRAQAGDGAAEFQIGLRYLSVAPRDPVAAFHWITLAAIQGKPVAQYRLATLYALGTGTAADPTKALQWYEAAALQGNRKAMHDLAVAYAQGAGTAKNPSEAVRWFSRAAALGYVDSEFNLAVLYERGDGVPQSLLDAYKWYSVAGRQGDAESKQRVEALHSQLGADDLTAAQRAADAFKPAPYDMAAN
ncbi:MAG: hypothetical protein WDM91_02525 [Rhizomicrobium sp.]